MINYSEYSNLDGVYLEDSYVLDITEQQEQFVFKLDAVLTPDSPLYSPPSPGEQYCHATGYLIFSNVSAIEWLQRSPHRYVDAAGEVDLGNIDSLTFDDGAYLAEGDWGCVKIRTNTQPRFEIGE